MPGIVFCSKPGGSRRCFDFERNTRKKGIPLVLLLFDRNVRVVLCCELRAHTRTAPPLWAHSTFAHHHQLPAEQINEHCGLGSPHHLLLLFYFEASRTSHLTAVATCLPRTFWLCLAGHRQSSLGVHISYELVHPPIAIPWYYILLLLIVETVWDHNNLLKYQVPGTNNIKEGIPVSGYWSWTDYSRRSIRCLRAA